MLLFLAWGCVEQYPKVPNHILAEEEMVPIVLQLLFAEEYYNERKKVFKDINRADLQKKIYPVILDQFNVEDSLFYRSFAFYEAHPYLQERIYDSVLSKLNRLKYDSDSVVFFEEIIEPIDETAEKMFRTKTENWKLKE